ncbi:MAG: iron-sulfur cluster-binding domain-containing protein [Flavipsychrobacter sp.]|nr:iron-sulfur cluster-binding domain-containing protein [Flavipsychrobacter sp.]
MEVRPTDSNIYKLLRISAIRQETQDVKTFIFEPLDIKIPYSPGQFLTFIFNHHHKEERRSFSISSSPALAEPLSITLKRIENGAYSRLLIDRTQVGDILYTTGAAGLFTLPADIANRKQLFFLAAGIGITPVFSLLKTALHEYHHLQVVLIYSNRHNKETVFYNDLVALEKKFAGRLRIEFLFSNSFDLSRARLSKWLLPTLISEYATVAKEDILYYICGPFTYMRMAIISLQEQGVPDANIRKENFDTVTAIPHILPPDTEPHNVVLNVQGQQYNFTVQYPQSILQAAKKLHIPIPYSCETGRCGSCSALCTTGTVWLSYNEVLTDTDLAAGKVLTCTGYPVKGNITLTV